MARFRKKELIENNINEEFELLKNNMKNCFSKETKHSWFISAKGTSTLYNIVNTQINIDTNYLELILSRTSDGTLRKIDLKSWYDIDDWMIRGITSSYIENNTAKKLPKKLREYIAEYKSYYSVYKNNEPEEVDAEDANNYIVIHKDENNRIVTNEVWLEMAELAESMPRPKYESRAVICDGYLCVNASAAIETLPMFEEYKISKKGYDPRKSGNELYDACDKHTTFRGATVWYATKEEILTAIKNKKGE